MFRALQGAKWAGKRSNPRYLIFSQVLYRLSYQPKFSIRVGLFNRQESQRKRPDVALTPGLVGSSKSKAKCHKHSALTGPFIRRLGKCFRRPGQASTTWS